MSAFINNSISSCKIYYLGPFYLDKFLLIHLYLFCYVNCIIFMYMIYRRSKYRNYARSTIWWTFSGCNPYNSRCDHHLQTIRNTCQQAVSCHSWNHFKTSLVFCQYTWVPSVFFRDELTVKFSYNDACCSAKVVDSHALQNIQTKDKKVMMKFCTYNGLSSISKVNDNSVQTFIIYIFVLHLS